MVHRELRLIDEDGELRDRFDPRCTPQRKVAYEVGERRAADKLAHFERWAVLISKDIPEYDARMAKMRALLPKGLIGNHAMSHIRHHDEFRTDRVWIDRFAVLFPTKSKEAQAADRRARVEAEHERDVQLLKAIVESGWGHRLLNRAIQHAQVMWPVWTLRVPSTQRNGDGKWVTTYEDKEVLTPVGPTRARKLHGLGDVGDFLRDLHTAAHNSAVVSVDPYIDRTSRPVKYYYRDDKEERRTYTYEYVKTTRSNPAHHPEWLVSVRTFLNQWSSARGDRKKLLSEHPALRVLTG